MTHHYSWLFQFSLSVHQLGDPQSLPQHMDQPLHPLCPGLLWGCAVHWWWWASTVWSCKQQTNRQMKARQGIAGSQQCVLWCCMLLLRDVSNECTASIFRVWVKIIQHHNTKTQRKFTACNNKQKKTQMEAIAGISRSRCDIVVLWLTVSGWMKQWSELLYCDWQWLDEWNTGVNYSVDSQYLIAFDILL